MKKKGLEALTMLLCLSFLLGVRGGRLALWQGEDPEPVRVYELRVDSLPPADRLLLERGIRLDSEEALYAALEDYL